MNTIIGALVAAIIAGLTAALVLLNGPNVTSLSDITGLQWTILGIGVALAFAKDFQAITVRRMANKLTHTGDGGINSPWPVGILAILLTMSMIAAGCTGTRSAYRAAEGPTETAKVVAEHYYALVREANDMRDDGTLSGSALSTAQDLVRTTRPVILELASATQAYEAVASAENAEELQRALNEAALAVSRLVEIIRAARNTVTQHLELELRPEHLALAA